MPNLHNGAEEGNSHFEQLARHLKPPTMVPIPDYEWIKIVELISLITDIKRNIAPRDIRNTIISGDVLAELVEAADRIRSVPRSNKSMYQETRNTSNEDCD